MTIITGLIYDSGGVVINEGGLIVKIDSPIIDRTVTPNALYTEIERDFPIINGQLPLYDGVNRGILLPQTETLNTTYSLTLYQNVEEEEYYFQDGRPYGGAVHLHTDGKYYTGFNHSVDAVLLDRILTTVKDTIGETFHAVIPNKVTVNFADLIPSRISTDTLPATIQQISEVLVNTPQYLALLTQQRWQGNYDNTRIYTKYDEVFYAGSSWIYVSNTPSSGNTPSAAIPTIWQVRTAKGDPGGTNGQDTPYNATGWLNALWSPSANALRNIIEQLARVSQLANYAPILNAVLTSPTRNASPALANNDRSQALATTSWIGNNFATLDSPTFVNNPSALTQPTTDVSNKLATTNFVNNYFAAYAKMRPYFLVRKTDNTTFANGSNTIIFNQEVYDSDNAFNAATGIFTVPAGKEGLYEFVFSIYFERLSGSTGYDLITEILVNSATGHRISQDMGINISNFIRSGTRQIYLSAGQTVAFRVVLTLNSNSIATNNNYSGIILTEASGKRLLT